MIARTTFLLAVLLILPRSLEAQVLPDGGAPDDILRRMAERRAQQLQQAPPAVELQPQTVQPAPPPAAPPTTNPSTLSDAAWNDLLTRLASDSFATRQSAQKDLDTLTWRDLGPLKKALQTASDPEAKSRLAARVETLEEQIAADPPPLSLDLKDASLNDVVAALEQTTGENFSDPNNVFRGGNFNARFTLSVRDKPFWEIFRDLNDQNPLQITSTTTGMRFAIQEPGSRPSAITGGMAVFARSLTRTASVDLQDPAQNRPPTLSIQYTIQLDPRMKFTRYQRAHLTEIHDDLGNSLLPPDRPAALTGWTSGPRTQILSAAESLQVPEKLGKKIVSAKGIFRLELQLATESIDMTEIDKKINIPQQVAGQSFTIRQFEQQGASIRFSFASTPTASRGPRAGSPGGAPPIAIAIIDSTGRQISPISLTGSSSGSISANNAVPPLKIRLTAATKTKQIDLPFELKDLPIP